MSIHRQIVKQYVRTTLLWLRLRQGRDEKQKINVFRPSMANSSQQFCDCTFARASFTRWQTVFLSLQLGKLGNTLSAAVIIIIFFIIIVIVVFTSAILAPPKLIRLPLLLLRTCINMQQEVRTSFILPARVMTPEAVPARLQRALTAYRSVPVVRPPLTLPQLGTRLSSAVPSWRHCHCRSFLGLWYGVLMLKVLGRRLQCCFSVNLSRMLKDGCIDCWTDGTEWHIISIVKYTNHFTNQTPYVAYIRCLRWRKVFHVQYLITYCNNGRLNNIIF